MSQLFSRVAFLSLMLITCSTQVKAEPAPELIGQFGKWQSYRYQEGDAPVCFVSVGPDKSEGKYKSRDPVYLMVTNRPAESSRNVVSFLAGYPFKKGAEVRVSVDGANEFILIGQENAAWTPDDATDQKLVNALKKGNKLVVSGVSARGTKTEDHFSLKGSGEAIRSIDQTCP